MVLGVSLETGRRRAGEYKAVALLPKQTGRHSSAWRHHGGIENPTFRPAGFQALSGDGEIRSGGPGIVLRVACHVALQARGALAREQVARHRPLLVAKRI